MKTRMLILTISLLLLSGCNTFHGVTVISPKVGDPRNPTKAESLQPILQWKASSQTDGTYDVTIYEGIVIATTLDELRGQVKRAVGKMVYYREGIKETNHKVEEPLKPNHEYYWSVRVRQGDQVSQWSQYDYFLFAGVGYVKGEHLTFSFKTPKK